MKFYIETDRLLLREVHNADVEDFFIMDSDPSVHKYLGNKPYTTIEESKKNIASLKQQYQDYNIGRWTVINKYTNEFIGWAGIKYIIEPINNHVNFHDVGYRLTKKQWGKGYASEAAKASIKYAFDVMKLNELHATAHVENIASQTILKKVGLKYVNDFYYTEDILCRWYAMKK